MKCKILIAGAALGLSVLGAASANAAVFTNGSFESPGGSTFFQLTTSSVPGWTYSSNSSYDAYQPQGTNGGIAAADGLEYISFGHNGTWGGSISQTFDTVAGQSYSVTYAFGEEQGQDTSQVLRAIVLNGTQTLTQDNNPTAIGFQTGTAINFTAQGASTTLQFLDATGSGGNGSSNLVLDAVNVSIGNVSGVPEPATWAMMLVGFGVLGAAMRSRRKTTTASA